MAKKRKTVSRKAKRSSTKKMKNDSDISNKALAGLLIAAIVISVSGTLMVLDKNAGLTGYATSQDANVSVNITGIVSIVLDSATLDFGTGSVTSGATNAILAYDGSTFTNVNGTGFSQSGDIILENDGNLNANITIQTTNDVATFIGGTSPAMEYLAVDNESGSCINGLESSYATLTTSPTNFCTKLNFSDSADTVKMGLRLTIPSDTIGYKSNTITFTASQN